MWDERARSHLPVVPRPLLRAVGQSASDRVPPSESGVRSDLASGIGAGEQDGSGGGSGCVHLGDVRAREDRERVETSGGKEWTSFSKDLGILGRERFGSVAVEVVGLGRRSLLNEVLKVDDEDLRNDPAEGTLVDEPADEDEAETTDEIGDETKAGTGTVTGAAMTAVN